MRCDLLPPRARERRSDTSAGQQSLSPRGGSLYRSEILKSSEECRARSPLGPPNDEGATMEWAVPPKRRSPLAHLSLRSSRAQRQWRVHRVHSTISQIIAKASATKETVGVSRGSP